MCNFTEEFPEEVRTAAENLNFPAPVTQLRKNHNNLHTQRISTQDLSMESLGCLVP